MKKVLFILSIGVSVLFASCGKTGGENQGSDAAASSTGGTEMGKSTSTENPGETSAAGDTTDIGRGELEGMGTGAASRNSTDNETSGDKTQNRSGSGLPTSGSKNSGSGQ